MTKFNELKANFSSGEISPKFYGRKDLVQHEKGARLLENFIPMGEGGFSKRIGTEFMADVSSIATATGKGPALIPYISRKDEGFVIVINAEGLDFGTKPWISIYRNDGVPATVPPPPGLTSIPAADLDPKKFVYAQIGDVIWITHTSARFKPILIRGRPDTGVFTIADFDQPNILTPDNPNFGRVSPAFRVPYRDQNISPTTLTPSATTGAGITITASTAIFDEDMVGSYFRIIHGATEGVIKITAFTSDTQLVGDVIVDFGSPTASDDWAESAWSDYRGWPRTVTAFEQRLVWGGALYDPDTIWFSLLGNPLLMAQKRLVQDLAGDTSGLNYFIPTTIPDEQKKFNGAGVQFLEDDPFSVTIGSTEANPVSWMSSGRDLAIGTLGGEYILSAVNGGLSILTVTVRKQTTFGGSPVKVVRSLNEVLYFTRNGQNLRSFKYNESNGSYLSANISLIAEHFRKVGNTVFDEYAQSYEYLDVFLQQGKDVVWAINSKNQLVGVNYSIENENIGWFRTIFPNGNDFPVFSQGQIDSCNIWGVTVVPNEEGENDDVWLVVERQNDGGSVFCLERMGSDFDAENLSEQVLVDENIPLYLDSSIVVDNTAGNPISTISGLDHLEGHTDVYVFSRGNVLGPYTVTAGEITITGGSATIASEAGVLVVGKKYKAQMETLDLEAGLNIGTSEGQIQRIDRVVTRFYNSREVKIGSTKRQDSVKFRLSSVSELSSDSIRTDIPNSPDYDNIVKLVSEEPFPCTVLSMALRGNTYD